MCDENVVVFKDDNLLFPTMNKSYHRDTNLAYEDDSLVQEDKLKFKDHCLLPMDSVQSHSSCLSHGLEGQQICQSSMPLCSCLTNVTVHAHSSCPAVNVDIPERNNNTSGGGFTVPQLNEASDAWPDRQPSGQEGIVYSKVKSGQVGDLVNESLFGAPGSDSSDSDSQHDSDQDKDRGVGGCFDSFLFKDGTFSFLTWNVNGLMTKISDSDFVSFILSFHFVCLVETFIDSFNVDMFSSHKAFCQPSVKLSQAGRSSGGIVCLIKRDLLPFVHQIKTVGHTLMFIIDKVLFGVPKDVLFVCAYVPPEGSAYYNFIGEEGNGISLLENLLFDNALHENDLDVILCGDLNSRTSNVSQPVFVNDNFLDSLITSGSLSANRSTQDNVFNSFGKTLINMCTALNLCILNGMCEGDRQGRYTYISPFGSSVIDYFVLSCELAAVVWDDCILRVLDRIESCHMPVVFSAKFPNLCKSDSKSVPGTCYIEKYSWDQSKADKYKECLLSISFQQLLQDAINLIDNDINSALNKLNEVIKLAAIGMKKRVWVNKGSRQQGWFDKECRTFRKKVRKSLRSFKSTLSGNDRFNYCKLRREYKNLIYRKKKDFNNLMINKLIESINCQESFWKQIHEMMPRKKMISNNIQMENWFQHFKLLLEKEDEQDVVVNNEVLNEDQDNNHVLNRPITEEEILLAIRKLKLRKAAGPDGLVGEFYKYANEIFVPFFVKFFNFLFDKGIYPDNWCESVILPLYKKGDANNPGNYRGISLLDISSKIYGNIINRRLQAWVDENNLTGEVQAGFKKGYSTIDHMFTLMACVQKQLSLHRKLYVAFIDFEKCFDSINRNLLWQVLLKNGIKGKLFQSVKSMYNSVKARVRSGSKLTDLINCTCGVKQGDSCSPVLFSIFINELAVEVINKGRHGVTFGIDILELFILLLADDIILLSETPIGLQRQLNSLQSSAVSLGLNVNMDKSNIIVFRNGGYLGIGERWMFQGMIMPVVNAYKYLGIYFSTRLSFNAACSDIASKAKRVLFVILNRLRLYNNHSFDIFIRLFDGQVQPILQYGSEIWGMDDAANQCERVHLYALKKFLLVNLRTPNDFVYKELSRYPILIHSKIRCIAYWLKLLAMNENRIPKKAYLMLRDLDEKGKRNWVTRVRECLYKYGFGYVWINQGVPRVKTFISMFKQRLIDCRWQEWHEHVNNSNRFSLYNMFCGNDINSLPVYLKSENIDRHVKWIMTKFRFGISDLFIHKFRYRNNNTNIPKCPLCKNAEDNEIHFVLCCPALQELRELLIKPKFYRNPNNSRFNILMSSHNLFIAKNLACYVYRAFQLRERLLS